MNNFHSTALVSSKARIGSNVQIGPYAIIHDDVEIGDECKIGPHVVCYDGARIGKRVKIYQSASIAHIPQDLKFSGEPTEFIIGDDSTIHEFVTLHRGTQETKISSIGKNCLIMAYSHVAHDTNLGNNCILANGVQLAGHVTLQDWVIIGGLGSVHQFCKIGQHSMVGAGCKIVMDVPPFILAGNIPPRYYGLNVIGLKRRGFSKDDIANLKKVYDLLYNSGMNFGQAKKRIDEEFGSLPIIRTLLEFINNSTRGILRK